MNRVTFASEVPKGEMNVISKIRHLRSMNRFKFTFEVPNA